MAVSKTDKWADSESAYPAPNVDEPRADKETSISAHIVRSISVNMSFAEIDVLVNSLGKMREDLTNGELAVQRDFTSEVERVRFA
jgi:hypothetical protein